MQPITLFIFCYYSTIPDISSHHGSHLSQAVIDTTLAEKYLKMLSISRIIQLGEEVSDGLEKSLRNKHLSPILGNFLEMLM